MRWIVLSIVLVGLIGAGMAWKSRRDLLNSGYCAAEDRYLTDEEIVDAAVAGFIELLDKTPSIIVQNDMQKTLVDENDNPVKLSFSSVEDFYNQNPYCCYPIVQGEKRHIVTPSFAFDNFGYPRYEPKIYLTVEGKSYSVRTGAVTACGEYIPYFDWRHRPEAKPIKFRESSVSSIKGDRERFDRRKQQKND